MGCIFHEWTKWSEPRTARVDDSPAMVQDRECKRCNKHQWRFV